jgi:hypothetical protein
MTTPRYFITIRPNGTTALRYWMFDGTSAHIRDYATREGAEVEAARLNARQAAGDAASAARVAAEYPQT